MGLAGNSVLTIPLAAGILLGAYALARFLWTGASKRSGRMYRRMVDVLTAEIARLAESPASGEPALPSASPGEDRGGDGPSMS